MKIEAEEFDESIVTLDTYNSDLNLVINASHYSAHPLTNEGFAFMWAGARATHGSLKGKFCFEVKLLDHLDVSHLPVDEPSPHVIRVGFSVESSTLQLGEDPLSYGYGGTGKISTNCQFKDFGESFISGDVILAAVNMDSEQIQLGFAKNGKFLGWAYCINRNELKGQGLFPHILTKNVSFEVNFGQKEKSYFPLPDSLKDFVFINCLPLELRISGVRPPKKKQDCEIIMMCGLPGAGKSVWAAEHSKKNPAKKFNVLGTNNIIDKMKVMGLPRKRNYAGRWDVLIQMATKCLNKMFEIGSKMRRNYILDQTNVYPNAQRRKMRPFMCEGFKCVAVVVVPTEAEYKRRCDKRDREEGKEVPDHAVLEMKANFKLPEVNDIFKEVIYTELQQQEAKKLVAMYNEEGKAAVGPPRKQFKSNEHFSSHGNNRGMDTGQRDMSRNNFAGSDSYQNRGNRGGYDSNRGGHDGGRGGYNSGRGGYDSGRGGYNSGRGGYDSGRGGYDSGRGGYNSGRGGYNSGRGGYDSGRGGYGNDSGRGGNDSGRGGNDRGRGGNDRGRGGGYNSSRGGNDSGQGGYNSGRGGNDSGRGGYNSSRGGYDSARGGGYDSGRRGYDSNQGHDIKEEFGGGFDSDRGGYGENRGSSDRIQGGFNNNRGGFDSSSGGFSRGGHDGNTRGGYNRGRGVYDRKSEFSRSSDSEAYPGGYNDEGSQASYGNNSRGFGSRGGPRGRNDFGRGKSSGNANNYGNRDFSYGDDNLQQYGDNSYTKKSVPGAFDKNDSKDQQGFQGAASFSTFRGGESRGRSRPAPRSYGGRENISDRSFGNDFNYETSSSYSGGYSNYQDNYAEKTDVYRGTTEPHKSQPTPYGPVKTEPGMNARSYESGDKTVQRSSRPSGRATRWSAENPQSYSERNESLTQATGTYSTFGVQVKTEPIENAETSGYRNYNAPASSFPSYVPGQSNQGYQGTQSHGYQTNVPPPSTVTQSWTGSQNNAVNPISAPGSQNQQQWAQYYQQQSQPGQYYNQYYGQQAPATAPAYGSTYGAK